MPDLTPDELRDVVLDRRSEVLMILYMDATRRWAEAHLNTAKAAGDVQILKAKCQYLETLIENEKSRMARIATQITEAETATQ